MTAGHTLAAAAAACATALLLGLGALASCAGPDGPLGGMLAVACAAPPSSPPAAANPAAPEAAGGAEDVGVGDVRRWDGEQFANAAVIVEVGRQLRVPAWGQVVAVAAAMQESSLRNLPGGDRDSVGLFQQRPSQGWGTPAQLGDPAYAAGRFYHALLAVPGWQQMPVAEAAQRVQRSAFPFAYEKWTADAITLVTAVGSAFPRAIPEDLEHCPSNCPGTASNASVGDPSRGSQPQVECSPGFGSVLPAGAVGVMLHAALDQVGDPYVYAATGPDAFDCSGLVVYAWAQAGYRLTVRTAEQMRQVSTPIPAGRERPGDLVFSEFNTARVPGGAGHVAIVVRKGLLVEAPRTGLTVRVRAYAEGRPGLRFGRLSGSVLRRIGAGGRAFP